MKMQRYWSILDRSWIAAAMLVIALPAWADSVDKFDNGENPNGWTFNVIVPESVEPSGGNPGGWLHNPFVVSFAPILTTDLTAVAARSPLVQAFKLREVRRITIDVNMLAGPHNLGGRPLTLMIKTTKGTRGPQQWVDDDFVYILGEQVPEVGKGWTRFVFEVPSNFTGHLPPGWIGGRFEDMEHFRPGADWNTVLDSVDLVQFWWGDPRLYYLVQSYALGVDNIIVETQPSPRP